MLHESPGFHESSLLAEASLQVSCSGAGCGSKLPSDHLLPDHASPAANAAVLQQQCHAGTDASCNLWSELDDEIIFNLDLGMGDGQPRPPPPSTAGLISHKPEQSPFSIRIHWEAIACDQSPWGHDKKFGDDTECEFAENPVQAFQPRVPTCW